MRWICSFLLLLALLSGDAGFCPVQRLEQQPKSMSGMLPGTGYSSLSDLKRLRLTALKIYRSFTLLEGACRS